MKKIGIFTFFQTNYGAVLQAYALQSYLQEQPDTEVEIIDFTTANHLKDHLIFKKSKSNNLIIKIYTWICTLIHYRQLKARVDRTWKFKSDYFHFTRRYSSIQDVLENHPHEDIYFTGSDQVFNPRAPYVPVYYLGFDKGKGMKVAYAPSFGISEFNSEITEKISDYIKDFDFLSCREEPGAKYLESISGRSVPVVVDPVLLHDAEKWGKIATKPSLKKDYIFIYDLNGGDNLISIAKKIQKEEKLPIICLTGNRTKHYPVDKQIYDAGPAEFVGWVQNAKYVVTDSFHGTVFSLIFNKKFFTFIALEKTSARIKNILGRVGLTDRIITKDKLQSFRFSKEGTLSRYDLRELSDFSRDYINMVLNKE